MSTDDLAAIIERAAEIAEHCSAVPMSHFRHAGLEIEQKADESPVTRADRETEEALRAALADAFPDHGIFGEEFGVTGGLDGRAWVIDPIDGTRSFLSGYPTFGMLLAHIDEGRALGGVIRMPALGETFTGWQGGEARLNGRTIRARGTTRLDEAILYVNEYERMAQSETDALRRLLRTGQTRRMAYDCYPHALVAAGCIDAVTDIGLEPYDYLALVPVIEAAGAVITDWQGRALDLNSDGRVITAATPELHARMLEVAAG